MEHNFCSKCGAALPHAARFCPACGQAAGGSAVNPALEAQVLDALQREGKIAAIKLLRENTPGMGLADAKLQVEQMEEKAVASGAIVRAKRGGCLGVMACLAVLVAAMAAAGRFLF